MKQVSLTLTISLMSIAFLMGGLTGYYITPQYQQTMFAKEEMGLGEADRFVDLRYINKMASHHKEAILLADQADNVSHREEIRKLANEIKINEPKLIEELYGWKRNWYNDGGKVSDPVVPRLGAVDETFDLRFLNALIAHHEAGIEMTEEIREKSSRSEILDNANSVENFLTKSLSMLKGWRNEWYQVN